ncbi:hypothetical protein Tco_0880377 [Tanacetum coccineum]
MTSNHNSSELGIHDHNNELSSSKLVPKVVPSADKTTTSRQELELLFHHHITMLRIFMTNFNHKINEYKGIMPTKIELTLEQSQQGVSNDVLTKTSANSDIKDPSSETKLQGRLLASFQDDAKYEHVGQDTRWQDGKDDQDIQGKI